MFRNVVRIKQALPEEECIKLLKETKRGVMSVLGDDDYPYGMPLNHWYDEESGRLLGSRCLRTSVRGVQSHT